MERQPIVDNQFLDEFLETIRRRASENKRILAVSDMEKITRAAKAVLAKEKALVDIVPPINVCGDTHGNLFGLLQMLNVVGWPPNYRYVFLGDYVDRGKRGIEVLSLLLALKLRYPDCIYMLRGNHEEREMNISMKEDGFKAECLSRYGPKVWYMFTAVFAYLPLCAVIGGKIMCMHGGIPRNLTDLDTIRQLRRPTHGIPEKGFVCDLLWADPTEKIQDWADNERGASYVFGQKALADFCEQAKINMIIRAHEVAEEGVRKFGDRLITVFSSPNYCGGDNSAGMIYVDDNLQVHAKEFKPMSVYEALRSLLKSFHECLRSRGMVVKDWPRVDTDLTSFENKRPKRCERRVEYCSENGGDVQMALDVEIKDARRILVTMVQPKAKETIEWSNVGAWNEGERLWTLLTEAHEVEKSEDYD